MGGVTMSDERNDSGRALLADLLACPACHGALALTPSLFTCTSCGQGFPQSGGAYYDFLSRQDGAAPTGDDGWARRQEQMEGWYRDLVADPVGAASCLQGDYEPYAPLIAGLSGVVLDLGGGSGITRHYLHGEVRYVVLDPSLGWLDQSWGVVAAQFSRQRTATPQYVRGVGEQLPFRDRTFDAVLAFWSLNHVKDPERVFSEVGRVLKPEGLFVAVLEDMEPRWADFFDPAFRKGALRHLAWAMPRRSRPRRWRRLRRRLAIPEAPEAIAVVVEKVRCSLLGREWPKQEDHIRIQEAELQAWGRRHWRTARRSWDNPYLTYTFQHGVPRGMP